MLPLPSAATTFPMSRYRRLFLVVLLLSFALTAVIHPDLVFFGIAPPDPRTF